MEHTLNPAVGRSVIFCQASKPFGAAAVIFSAFRAVPEQGAVRARLGQPVMPQVQPAQQRREHDASRHKGQARGAQTRTIATCILLRGTSVSAVCSASSAAGGRPLYERMIR